MNYVYVIIEAVAVARQKLPKDGVLEEIGSGDTLDLMRYSESCLSLLVPGDVTSPTSMVRSDSSLDAFRDHDLFIFLLSHCP
jgi:hypothetical protein